MLGVTRPQSLTTNQKMNILVCTGVVISIITALACMIIPFTSLYGIESARIAMWSSIGVFCVSIPLILLKMREHIRS